MLVSEMLADGLVLLVMGMGIVFGFLIVLVFALKGMSALAAWLEGEAPQVQPFSAEPAQQTASQSELIAVISAAVQKYRSEHRQN